MLAVWQSRLTYQKHAKHALKTHFYRAAYSAIITHLRKLGAQKRRGCIEIDDVCSSFEEEVVGMMLVDEIRRLAPEQADLFLDRHLDGLTLKELAAKYDLTERQVRYRLEKTQQLLQEELEWEGDSNG